jgi:putative transposase
LPTLFAAPSSGKYQGKLGDPKRTSKKRGLGGLRLTGSMGVFPEAIYRPRLGRLRLKEHGYLPTGEVKVLSATVTEQSGHWDVCVLGEHEQPALPMNRGPVVGVDLGLTRLATRSDGAIEENPRHLKQRRRKIKRLHRAVTRKRTGSHTRQKAARCLGVQ